MSKATLWISWLRRLVTRKGRKGQRLHAIFLSATEKSFKRNSEVILRQLLSNLSYIRDPLHFLISRSAIMDAKALHK